MLIHRLTMCLICTVVLAGCASATDGTPGIGEQARRAGREPSNPPATTRQPGIATLLLPVAFINVIRPGHAPALLELSVVPEGGQVVAFVQRATLPTAADSAGTFDYLFRLPLPQGRYRISRIAGTARAGETTTRFAVPVDIPFTVKSDAVRYMGRLVAQNVAPLRFSTGAASGGRGDDRAGQGGDAAGLDGGVLQFNTAWTVDADLAQYRESIAGIAREAIEFDPFESITVMSRSNGFDNRTTARSFEELNVSRVATTLAPPRIGDPAGLELTAGNERLRTAFERYSAAASPKAFAVSAGGEWGFAVGTSDASARALVECAHKGQRCRLFAVDDRLVVERNGGRVTGLADDESVGNNGRSPPVQRGYDAAGTTGTQTQGALRSRNSTPTEPATTRAVVRSPRVAPAARATTTDAGSTSERQEDRFGPCTDAVAALGLCTPGTTQRRP